MKKVLSLFLILIVGVFAFGCGEQTFDDIPYSALSETETIESITEKYEDLRAITSELNVKYTTSMEIVIGTNTYNRDIITTVGKLNYKEIVQIVVECKTNGVHTKTLEQTCYDGNLYTKTSIVSTGEHIKVLGTYDTNTYRNAKFIELLLPELLTETLEETATKVFEETKYYKTEIQATHINQNIFSEVADEEALINAIDNGLVLTYKTLLGQKVYNKFGTNALSYKLSTNYILDYYVEYGYNTKNYVTMYRTEYVMQNDQGKHCGKVKSTTLLSAFGQDVKDIALPADIADYSAEQA